MNIKKDLQELQNDFRCTIVHIDAETVELSDLYVPEPLRHTGIGKQIVLRTIAQAKQLGAKHVQVHVPAAYMGWWSELGFKAMQTEVHMMRDL